MSGYQDQIGDFSTLQTVAFKGKLAKAFYIAILREKENIAQNQFLDNDPNFMYETLDMALHPPEKEVPKPTYRGIRKIKDRDTGIVDEEECDIPLKKFVTVTVEAKTVLIYLLNAYIKEAHAYYKAHKHTFPADKDLFATLTKYSKEHYGSPVLPFIVRSVEKFRIEHRIQGGYLNIEKAISNGLPAFFKDGEDRTPEAKLNLIIGTFIKFISMLAVASANMLFEKRAAINAPFMFGLLRQFSVYCNCDDEKDGLVEDTYMFMRDYVEANKPKKKEKSEDDEKKKLAKPHIKKSKTENDSTSKKMRGRPKASKADDPADDEGEVDTTDIDDAIDMHADDFNDNESIEDD